MKIEAGKYYKTRDGRKVGPAKDNSDGDPIATYPFDVPHDGNFYGYTADGKSCIECREDDIVAEWTSLAIQEGRYYIDGHGEKRGPMKAERAWFIDDRGWSFYADGQRMAKSGETGHPDHLVSEWVEPAADGPVRTITRREIVPGEYGGVVVEEHVGSVVHLHMLRNTMDSLELRSAAMVLSQLAEALDDK